MTKCPKCGDNQWGGTTVGPQCETCGFFPAEEPVPYRLSFRIRRVYFDQIVAGTKTAEVRKATKFWATRAHGAQVSQMPREFGMTPSVVAVFVCGKKTHRRLVTKITTHRTPGEALGGMTPFEHGREDLGEGPCYAFHLGAVLG